MNESGNEINKTEQHAEDLEEDYSLKFSENITRNICEINYLGLK